MTGISAKQAWDVYRRAELLHDHDTIESALDRMASGVHARLADCEPIVVCLMNGGVIPCGRLLPRLEFPLEIETLNTDEALTQQALSAVFVSWFQTTCLLLSFLR